jgi:hypothetical protein
MKSLDCGRRMYCDMVSWLLSFLSFFFFSYSLSLSHTQFFICFSLSRFVALNGMDCGCFLRWVLWGSGLLIRHSLRLLGILLIFLALFITLVLGSVFLQDTCHEIYECYWNVWGFSEKLVAFVVIGLFIMAYCSCIFHFLACVFRGPGYVPKNWVCFTTQSGLDFTVIT